MDDNVVVKATVQVGGMFDRSYCACELRDGTKFEMDFYPDEISFTSSELMGRTKQECYNLKGQKDLAYLKS